MKSLSRVWLVATPWTILRRRQWRPTPVLLPGKSHGWRSLVVAKSQTWLSNFTFTFHFYALEKEMATHSSVLAWRIPGMGLHRVGHNWSDLAAAGLYCPWNSPGQNTGVGRLSLLQGIFPTQGLNSGTPHCRKILYQLSHKGSPRTLKLEYKWLIHSQTWFHGPKPHY